MSIVWIDIWDYQSGSKAKCLINRYFNIGRYTATIRGANMNLGVPQCKIAGSGNTQLSLVESRGRNASSATDHTNRKTTENLGGAAKWMKRWTYLVLKPKKVILACTHSNVPIAEATTKLTPSSAHSGNTGFNREWQQKKYIEIHENKIKSICSTGSAKLH